MTGYGRKKMSEREQKRLLLTIADNLIPLGYFGFYLVAIVISTYRYFGAVNATLILIIHIFIVYFYIRKRMKDNREMESIMDKFMRRKTYNPGKRRKNTESIEKEKETSHQNDGE